MINLVDSKDLWSDLISLDGQEGLCEKEDECKGLNNLVDSKGLTETEGQLVNSDELEDCSHSIEDEKRLNNLVDSKDVEISLVIMDLVPKLKIKRKGMIPRHIRRMSSRLV